VPRKDRSFTTRDILRIIEANLSAVEQADVIFTLRTGKVRSAMAKGLDPDTPRLVEKLLKKFLKLRGGSR
jgi:hypothetical protein